MVHGLAAMGLDPDALLRSSGIDPGSLVDPEVRVPEVSLLAVWLAAQRAHGGPTFGLELAQHIPFGKLELIDYLVGTCASVRDGLECLAHHGRLCASGFRYRFEPSVDDDHGPGLRVQLEHHLGSAMLPRGMVEYFWALMILRVRHQQGPAFAPVLALRGGPAGPSKRYRDALGTTPRDGETDALWISDAQLALDNPKQDATLGELLGAHARDVEARLGGEDFDSRVRGAVVQALHRGDPRLSCVSARLGLSTRTLQRHLAAQDRSYAQLLDSVRRELALQYLTRSQLSLQEISDLLAYADPSVFGRAFRRWTGKSPHSYRQLSGERNATAPRGAQGSSAAICSVNG
jgi:AraC-like DNA-binding protein